MKLPKLIMSLDVESVGLHGEPFAFGYVVVDTETRAEVETFFARCPLAAARGLKPGRDWVTEHVEPALCIPVDRVNGARECADPRELLEVFWQEWELWRGRGVWLVADCPWPVEARFLAACIDAAEGARDWHGPYPLIDVASARLAADLSPLGSDVRLPSESPVHHPVADARQSARLLLESLDLVAPP